MRNPRIRQQDIDTAVASLTGEDLGVIRSRGFSLVDPNNQNIETESDFLPSQIMDWDEFEMSRSLSMV